MTRTTKSAAGLVPFVLLVSSSLAQADENGAGRGESERSTQKWQSYSSEMSLDEYEQAVRANQKQVRRFVKTYSSEALAAAGVPRAGIAVLGAAAGLAVDGNARFHLNESKTFALQLDDVVGEDRALLFTVKKTW